MNGSDYGSASPNQTVFIRPLFIRCQSRKQKQDVLVFSSRSERVISLFGSRVSPQAPDFNHVLPLFHLVPHPINPSTRSYCLICTRKQPSWIWVDCHIFLSEAGSSKNNNNTGQLFRVVRKFVQLTSCDHVNSAYKICAVVMFIRLAEIQKQENGACCTCLTLERLPVQN